MKKILYIFLIVILAAGLFVAYKFGFNFNQNKLEARTYEEIKQSAEENLENLSIEDLYLLANREDDEKYYTALYNAYKKENPDIALQYLYNEFVVKNNRKIYPLLKEEAKSDVTFTATETGYKGVTENFSNNYQEMMDDLDGTFRNFGFLFVPKFYDSKSNDEFVYYFLGKYYENDIPPGFNLTPTSEWPIIYGRYIDKESSTSLDNNTEGYLEGEDKIYFKNIEGKTIVAFSVNDYYYPLPYEDYAPVVTQQYFYKDYLLEVTLAAEDTSNPKYKNMGIGTIDLSKSKGYMAFTKDGNEITQEEFEKNVVPIDKLVNLSTKESNSWIKLNTYGGKQIMRHGLNLSELNKIHNMVLYGYNISLDKEVDLPYLKPYLKHICTNAYTGLLKNYASVDENSPEERFVAYISDLDKDGYPEIIMNYKYYLYSRNIRENHCKVISYNPEKKMTYCLGDFIYLDGEDGGVEFLSGGNYEKDGKNYLALFQSMGGATTSHSLISLYEKNGDKLDFVDSTLKVIEYDSGENIFYPSKFEEISRFDDEQTFDEESGVYMGSVIPKENSKEKYESYFNDIFTEDSRKNLDIGLGFPEDLVNYKKGLKAQPLNDPEEIKNILLANKMLEVPKYKRVVIGDKFYPYSSLLKEEGAEYIDINVLKDLNNFNIDEDKIIKKNENKFVSLEDLRAMNLIQGEDDDYIILSK
ncbi:hypothetical protein KQI68_02450 [Peptoniphilus sp. MSJ-1]|uniref:Uncharacterized protein n=1 Tax=Peptoniphilus ovalis TaxID=2841503 RepID=A0ABS6FET8_9FIRM|nr:hypothetical protein [Peptoniphilus ovalis]MBU5668694.1 hypothetical protein [Peptoniphilus ovalis]